MSKVDVYVDGVFLTSAINFASPGETTQAWQKFAVTFTANSAKTTITFFNGDPAGVGGNNGLDDISLELAKP